MILLFYGGDRRVCVLFVEMIIGCVVVGGGRISGGGSILWWLVGVLLLCLPA